MRVQRLLLISVALVAAAPVRAADFTVTNSGITAYVINSASNPVLTLQRETTYTFAVNAPGHPFWIKTVQGTGTANAYQVGMTNNGTDNGTVTFVVPLAAPATLFYNCEFHPTMTNVIHIIDKLAVVPDAWSAIKSLYR